MPYNRLLMTDTHARITLVAVRVAFLFLAHADYLMGNFAWTLLLSLFSHGETSNVQEPSGVQLRQMVIPYYSDLWSRLLTGKKGDLGTLANGLCGREGTPLLPLARSTTLLAQVGRPS